MFCYENLIYKWPFSRAPINRLGSEYRRLDGLQSLHQAFYGDILFSQKKNIFLPKFLRHMCVFSGLHRQIVDGEGKTE